MKEGYRGRPIWETKDTVELVIIGLIAFIAVIAYFYSVVKQQEKVISRLNQAKIEAQAPTPATQNVTFAVPFGSACQVLQRQADHVLVECTNRTKK